jgi:hypothetical protein
MTSDTIQVTWTDICGTTRTVTIDAWGRVIGAEGQTLRSLCYEYDCTFPTALYDAAPDAVKEGWLCLLKY